MFHVTYLYLGFLSLDFLCTSLLVCSEAAAGGETPCLSGRSSVTLNHAAPEFKMPVSAAASGTVSVEAPVEDMPQGSAGHADGTSSEPIWYPIEDGTYGAYGYSAAYGAYTDEHGHAYYPDAYYQVGPYISANNARERSGPKLLSFG